MCKFLTSLVSVLERLLFFNCHLNLLTVVCLCTDFVFQSGERDGGGSKVDGRVTKMGEHCPKTCQSVYR